MFKEKKKLMIVYENKDEMALNYLKKLVEKDDDEEGKIIGTEDDSVSVIAWTEKVYQDNKTKGNISNKIIFLDDAKGAKNIIPIMDVKYSECGIKYGIAGSQAVISIKENDLQSDKEFLIFQDKFESLMEMIKEDSKKTDKSKEFKFHQGVKVSKIFSVILVIAYPFVGIPLIAGVAATDSFDRKNLREKMFLYAITKFYLEEMDDFLKS